MKFANFNIPAVLDYLFIAAIFAYHTCFVIQLYFLLVYHARLRSYRDPADSLPYRGPVSVVICARNEQHNLEKNLEAVLTQDYPDFEVVVVNDCSSDESDLVLTDFSQRFPHLRVVEITEHARYKHGKKFAVTLGIKAAKHDVLVFTDADCEPLSAHWLSGIAAPFSGTTELVLGYSPYERYPGLLNLFIRFETFISAVNYLSFTLSGDPYMGVGRNMAYTRQLFFKGKGFASHMHILSGDDDLFVNQNARAGNTVIRVDADAQVLSEPKRSFGAWLSQKRRHSGAGKAYRTRHRRILTVQALSGTFFYLALFALLAIGSPWWAIVPAFVLRLVIQIIVYWPLFSRLRAADLAWWLPLVDFIYYFYIVALNGITLFKKKAQWR